jgi:hypothetical protein
MEPSFEIGPHQHEPITDDVLGIKHGERDDCECCLCGHDPYYSCPDWLNGVDSIGSMTFTWVGRS